MRRSPSGANRTDFLAACKASDSRNKSLEEIRDKGAEVILAVFRMLKNSLVHAIDNKAVQLTVKESHTIISDFASTVGGYVSITYVEDTGDVRVIKTALRELRYAFRLFAPFADKRKVTIFGSARTQPDKEEYQQAVEQGGRCGKHRLIRCLAFRRFSVVSFGFLGWLGGQCDVPRGSERKQHGFEDFFIRFNARLIHQTLAHHRPNAGHLR